MGDSIMQGVDADGIFANLGDQVQYSFAQGTDSQVQSLFTRYQSLGYDINGDDFVSKTGAEMVNGGSIPNALEQAQQICNLSVKPDRIVVLLGGNDVCNRTTVSNLYTVQVFRDALKAALDTLGAPSCGLPTGAWVHVLSMPRIDLLRAAGLAKDAATGGSYCQNTAWPYVPCDIVISPSDPGDLDTVGSQIDAYNQGSAAEVTAADAAHGGTAGVHFTTDWQGSMSAGYPNTSVGTASYGADDISDLDCFHPSISGQQRLACIAWETWESENPDVASCF